MAIKNSVAHGKDFNVKIDDSGGTQRDVSGDCTEFSWPQACAIAEAMGGGDAYEEYLAGLKGSKVSGSLMLNDTALTGSYTVLKGAVGAKRTVTYCPFGATVDWPRIYGEVFITEVSISTSLTSVATLAFSGVTTGSYTVDTYAA